VSVVQRLLAAGSAGSTSRHPGHNPMHRLAFVKEVVVNVVAELLHEANENCPNAGTMRGWPPRIGPVRSG
jgi:hypothetical protein